jgi:hypothetical protein
MNPLILRAYVPQGFIQEFELGGVGSNGRGVASGVNKKFFSHPPYREK